MTAATAVLQELLVIFYSWLVWDMVHAVGCMPPEVVRNQWLGTTARIIAGSIIHCVSKKDTTQPPTIISTIVVGFQ